MNKLFVKLFFLSILAIPTTSLALFEARATYGILTSKQELSEICQGSCTAPSSAPGIIPTTGIGLDAIIEIPFFPMGLGMRYENMGLKGSSNGIEAELKYNRTAFLINYRIIDTLIHFGPIASIGLHHKGSMKITEGGTTRVDFSSDSMKSYSFGLELGVKPLIVVPIKVGAEAGFQSFKWDEATNTVDNSKKNLDLSGYYMKIFLGLDI